MLIALVMALIPGVSRAQEAPAFQSFSKFDFVPGEKIIAMEDFTQDSVGDFPAKWNTNASGEVVTLAGQSGRWLKLTKAGVFTADFITELPENVTVEFDNQEPVVNGHRVRLGVGAHANGEPEKHRGLGGWHKCLQRDIVSGFRRRQRVGGHVLGDDASGWNGRCTQ